MPKDINCRLREILDSTGLKLATWAQKLGVSQALLYNYLQKDRTPSFKFIQKVIHSHPEIALKWLIIGEGEMIKSTNDSLEEEELTKTLQAKISALEELVKAKEEIILSQKKTIESLENILSFYKSTQA